MRHSRTCYTHRRTGMLSCLHQGLEPTMHPATVARYPALAPQHSAVMTPPLRDSADVVSRQRTVSSRTWLPCGLLLTSARKPSGSSPPAWPQEEPFRKVLCTRRESMSAMRKGSPAAAAPSVLCPGCHDRLCAAILTLTRIAEQCYVHRSIALLYSSAESHPLNRLHCRGSVRTSEHRT